MHLYFSSKGFAFSSTFDQLFTVFLLGCCWRKGYLQQYKAVHQIHDLIQYWGSRLHFCSCTAWHPWHACTCKFVCLFIYCLSILFLFFGTLLYHVLFAFGFLKPWILVFCTYLARIYCGWVFLFLFLPFHLHTCYRLLVKCDAFFHVLSFLSSL